MDEYKKEWVEQLRLELREERAENAKLRTERDEANREVSRLAGELEELRKQMGRGGTDDPPF